MLSSAKLNATGLRWIGELKDFNFTIRYRPGKSNVDADTLSRMPERNMLALKKHARTNCVRLYNQLDSKTKGLLLGSHLSPPIQTFYGTKAPNYRQLRPRHSTSQTFNVLSWQILVKFTFMSKLISDLHYDHKDMKYRRCVYIYANGPSCRQKHCTSTKRGLLRSGHTTSEISTDCVNGTP